MVPTSFLIALSAVLFAIGAGGVLLLALDPGREPLEAADDPRDRGLGDVELLAGPGHPALPDHRPEVEEVVMVQGLHRGTIH